MSTVREKQIEDMRNRASRRQAPVPVTGVWLCNVGDKLEVRVEVAGEWRVAIHGYSMGEREQEISHIVEPLGILKGPVWK